MMRGRTEEYFDGTATESAELLLSACLFKAVYSQIQDRMLSLCHQRQRYLGGYSTSRFGKLQGRRAGRQYSRPSVWGGDDIQ